ncbi:MAG: DEAD/DEAH box helicase [Thermoguttaceae bacterium]|jgi:replicative superfamily II helicase|nr:DEAD/DEAH box helicase [Thermoguttaceae bacterium]
MSLHPIKALDHVIDEYADYLRTEFRAKDPQLREALERELDAPRFLAQEPFYQAHRPFKSGKRWRDLPIEPQLAKVMENRSNSEWAYLHQSDAIDELLMPAARPVVVTTGTGSGKTEAFLLPVLQNAVEDAATFKKPGLTAILVYPMNALANDQEQRIRDYLEEAGLAGAVTVAKYDRGTSQAEREKLRKNPPHILLTNYMMLEYLLVRPADREDVFSNHRCRFLVLDEVHTYRGILGSNIALLVRRLRVHLARARQDWRADPPEGERAKRYPLLVPVGASATIKSMDEEGLSHAERVRLRDQAVQEFFGALAGVEGGTIRVFGEELQDVAIPPEATYPPRPGRVNVHDLDVSDAEAVRNALCRLAGFDGATSLDEAARRYRLLWDLNRWLITRPMSLSQIVAQVREEVAERKETDADRLRAEVEAALVVGAALPDGTLGALRLRAHRFIRGGWQFHRCVNPGCGKLYPMGEEKCSVCNHPTAPLCLCRNCGADYLRLAGDLDAPLRATADPQVQPDWVAYEPGRFETTIAEDEEEEPSSGNGRRRSRRMPAQIKRRNIVDGSLDPMSLRFSADVNDYSLKVTLVPARTRCICCGGSAGSRNVITPVSLGTSAAVKVVGEGLAEALEAAHRDRPGHDGKQRLLVFSDARQDAAHQARFIIFASRYDRMRRRLMDILETERVLALQKAVELLSEAAVANRDNPHVPEGTRRFIPEDARNRIRAWEEAPLLDEIAVNAGYRGTLVNLGLAYVNYHQLDEYLRLDGRELADRLGVPLEGLLHICCALLDEMRVRGCLSREMLRHHPTNVACPEHIKQADWERRMKQPQGYPVTPGGEPEAFRDKTEVPWGIRCHNPWRKPKSGGQDPSLQRILKHLLTRLGGAEPDAEMMVDLIKFLMDGSFVVPVELFGARVRTTLLQVNAEVVRLQVATEDVRMHCNVCGKVMSGAAPGMPCPKCHGKLVRWLDSEVLTSRSIKRVRNKQAIPLVAGEHTAQITTAERAALEERFKAPASESSVNLLACSPTLEMGIDVGGLDAVVMRNIPPRPDNYAQRGGRAGRRSRVGLVLGYARSTPHDQYFYDKPREMIAGEVPAPALSLGNRDVLVRHLYAIVFGAAEPGLAGRMVEYVKPGGEVVQEAVDALIDAVKAKFADALSVAREAWGDDIMVRAGLDDEQLRGMLETLPQRIQHVVDCTARQVAELQKPVVYFAERLQKGFAALKAGELVNRLLGIQSDRYGRDREADDRSAGYPLRRFAEFGILPGYEFPSEPAALRLLGDPYEEDPVSVTRRFGIGQFQPDANVYARAKRWRVIGLDMASPWNPRAEEPTWSYRVCETCEMRYSADEPKCPRCDTAAPGPPLPSYEFAGFVAWRDESPILDEEDRYAARNLVSTYPQWDGDVVARWTVGDGWALRLSRNERVRWVNEGRPPTPKELDEGALLLHPKAKGYLLCPACGRMLTAPEPDTTPTGGRRKPRSSEKQDEFGHAEGCPRRGAAPKPLAISTDQGVEVLRLLVPVPAASGKDEWLSWGLSLGYSLLNGMQHHFMLGPGELDVELEGPWLTGDAVGRYKMLSLAFIDPSLGGSGYLPRIAERFHRVAGRASEHLDHPDCETACYRCLKSYQNQRHHEHLQWPQIMPALESLAGVEPAARPLLTGDIDDPGPWLEAYAAGVGSPLELKFLRLFEQHGFHPQKQVPVAPNPGEPPISIADFAVADRRLAIYIDGAAFHVGQRLRRDRFIRARLRNADPPWRVEEFRAVDLGEGARLVERLKRE